MPKNQSKGYGRSNKVNYGGQRKDGGHDGRTTHKEDWTLEKQRRHNEQVNERRNRS